MLNEQWSSGTVQCTVRLSQGIQAGHIPGTTRAQCGAWTCTDTFRDCSSKEYGQVWMLFKGCISAVSTTALFSSSHRGTVWLLIQINLTFIYSSFYRCFPGLFKDKQKCRPPSRLSKKRSGTKTTPIQFFLMDSPTERTPKPSDELMLLQAGLGRRTVNVPEDACHNEVCGMTLNELRTEICTKYY